MTRDLTQGSIPKGLLWFALPLICGNLFQQLYNLTDTWIVGRFIGEGALGAVGSSYTLLTFLTSILLGLCMGSAAYFSIQFGRGDMARLRQGIFQAFVLIGGLTLVLNVAVYLLLGGFLWLLRIPAEVAGLTRTYLLWIFGGIAATFLYNFLANLLRAVGDSATPLAFLGVSVGLNIGLDVLFVVPLHLGVMGAALATVIAQYASGLGLMAWAWKKYPALRVRREDMVWERRSLANVFRLSFFTCLQQSVMNFGILLVQGLVNSFGTAVMAAFAVAVKIDTVAYMPVQDFGNAFSTFVAQNYGAGKRDRIRAGVKWAAACVVLFCLAVGGAVCLLAPRLLAFFAGAEAAEVIAIGTGYLRIEGSCYLGIGVLFLLYGYFRAVNRPAVSLVLTVCSLGTRVALAYALSALPALGVTGIWLSIPIGWFFADTVGIVLWRRENRRGLQT
ncbi:MAG: MATE family efflux transporter [Clostridiales bacterium]|nr:MATE family efflux transporter [Clostridiales bacterium]